MPSDRIYFEGSQGHRLAARLDMPEGEPHAYAIFAHCFTCSKNLWASRNVSQALTESGCGVLRFDFTGIGRSEGEFARTTFTTNLQDLEKAAEYLAEHHGAPSLLVGHSLGGAAVVHAAGKIASVRAVATIGAPYEPGHVKHLFHAAIDTIHEAGEAEVTIGGRPFLIRREFLEDLERDGLVQVIRGMRRALLVLHAPMDDVVGIENAQHLFEAAMHPKSFVSLDTADHLLTEEADALYAGRVIAAWAARYIGN